MLTRVLITIFVEMFDAVSIQWGTLLYKSADKSDWHDMENSDLTTQRSSARNHALKRKLS